MSDDAKTYSSVSTAIKAYFDLTAKETMDYYKGCSSEERQEWIGLFAAVGIEIVPR